MGLKCRSKSADFKRPASFLKTLLLILTPRLRSLCPSENKTKQENAVNNGNPFLPSLFNKYFLRAYYVPGTVLDFGDILVKDGHHF